MRLQVEHQVAIGADELADFIDQEDEPVVRPLGIEIFLDPFAEVLDGQGEIVLGIVDPLLRRFSALAERLAERLDDLIPVELVGIPLVEPIPGRWLLCRRRGTPPACPCHQVAFHVGDVRVIAAVALHFVQDFEEDRAGSRPARPCVVGLAVDVEEDDIGVATRRPA